MELQAAFFFENESISFDASELDRASKDDFWNSEGRDRMEASSIFAFLANSRRNLICLALAGFWVLLEGL